MCPEQHESRREDDVRRFESWQRPSRYFRDEDDYAVFLRLFGHIREAVPMRGLADCLLEWTPDDELLIEFELFSDTAYTARRALCAITEESVNYDIGSRSSGVFRWGATV